MDTAKSKRSFFFASESVGEGHPDKLCDQIADAVLDECLREDKRAVTGLNAVTKSKIVSDVSLIHIDVPDGRDSGERGARISQADQLRKNHSQGVRRSGLR